MVVRLPVNTVAWHNYRSNAVTRVVTHIRQINNATQAGERISFLKQAPAMLDSLITREIAEANGVIEEIDKTDVSRTCPDYIAFDSAEDLMAFVLKWG